MNENGPHQSMSEMNILVVHEVSYKRKVIYEYQEYAEQFASRGHSVTVVDFDENEPSQVESESISRTGRGSVQLVHVRHRDTPVFRYFSARASHTRFLRAKLKKGEVDLVLLYSVFVNGTETVRLCKEFNIPVVFRALDVYHRIRRSLLMFLPLLIGEKYIYRNATKLSATNQGMKNYLLRMAGPSRCRPTDVDLHGVDRLAFKNNKVGVDRFPEWSFSRDDRIAVFVGSIYSFSGLDLFIENFDAVSEECPRAKLLVVGSGDLDSKLRTIIRAKQLQTQVVLAGRQEFDLVPDIISMCDLALNPFEINEITKEIIPIKLLQYLACGKPVLSSPLPDVKNLFPEHDSGIVYSDMKNPRAFARLAGRLLADEKRRSELGANALDFIRPFGLEEVISRWEEKFMGLKS